MFKKTALILALVGLTAVNAMAAYNATWTGAVSTEWAQPGNWVFSGDWGTDGPGTGYPRYGCDLYADNSALTSTCTMSNDIYANPDNIFLSKTGGFSFANVGTVNTSINVTAPYTYTLGANGWGGSMWTGGAVVNTVANSTLNLNFGRCNSATLNGNGTVNMIAPEGYSSYSNFWTMGTGNTKFSISASGDYKLNQLTGSGGSVSLIGTQAFGFYTNYNVLTTGFTYTGQVNVVNAKVTLAKEDPAHPGDSDYWVQDDTSPTINNWNMKIASTGYLAAANATFVNGTLSGGTAATVFADPFETNFRLFAGNKVNVWDPKGTATLKGSTIKPCTETTAAGIFGVFGNLVLAKNGSINNTLDLAVTGIGGVAGVDYSQLSQGIVWWNNGTLVSGSDATNPLADTNLVVDVKSGLAYDPAQTMRLLVTGTDLSPTTVKFANVSFTNNYTGTVSYGFDAANNVGYVELTNLHAALKPGDANKDTKVDDNDLNILLTNWGTGTDWAHGNFKGNGHVDDNDLNTLLSNWTGSGAAAPEPVTMSLLALGGAALLRRRK